MHLWRTMTYSNMCWGRQHWNADSNRRFILIHAYRLGLVPRQRRPSNMRSLAVRLQLVRKQRRHKVVQLHLIPIVEHDTDNSNYSIETPPVSFGQQCQAISHLEICANRTHFHNEVESEIIRWRLTSEPCSPFRILVRFTVPDLHHWMSRSLPTGYDCAQSFDVYRKAHELRYQVPPLRSG